jgi:hypothetical protein
MKPKAVKVELNRVTPNGSSGTGYDEPCNFKIYLDNGEVLKRTIYDWYRPYGETINSIKEMCIAIPASNLLEVMDMALDAWKADVSLD